MKPYTNLKDHAGHLSCFEADFHDLKLNRLKDPSASFRDNKVTNFREKWQGHTEDIQRGLVFPEPPEGTTWWTEPTEASAEDLDGFNRIKAHLSQHNKDGVVHMSQLGDDKDASVETINSWLTSVGTVEPQAPSHSMVKQDTRLSTGKMREIYDQDPSLEGPLRSLVKRWSIIEVSIFASTCPTLAASLGGLSLLPSSTSGTRP